MRVCFVEQVQTREKNSHTTHTVILKLWIFDGASPSSPLLETWRKTWSAMKKSMLRRSGNRKLLFLGEIDAGGGLSNKMGHLSCHMPAVLALAYRHLGDEEYLSIAEDLASTCYQL